jgi:hypothetical protein
MSYELDALRADFRTAAAWCLDCGEWSDEDVAEIGQAIKAAIDAQDLGEVAFWCEFMARYAVMARAHQDQMAALDREAAAWWLGQQRRAA